MKFILFTVGPSVLIYIIREPGSIRSSSISPHRDAALGNGGCDSPASSPLSSFVSLLPPPSSLGPLRLFPWQTYLHQSGDFFRAGEFQVGCEATFQPDRPHIGVQLTCRILLLLTYNQKDFLSSCKTQMRKHPSPGILLDAPNKPSLPYLSSHGGLLTTLLTSYGGFGGNLHHSPCGHPLGHTCYLHFLKLRFKRLSKSMLFFNVVAEGVYHLQTL